MPGLHRGSSSSSGVVSCEHQSGVEVQGLGFVYGVTGIGFKVRGVGFIDSNLLLRVKDSGKVEKS
jgi:hypothetical protein